MARHALGVGSPTDLQDAHPFVIGELACGTLVRRSEILALMAAPPAAPFADHHAVLAFVEARRLAGRDLGWNDLHLLASAARARIPVWTLDGRLEAVAERLGLGLP